MALELERAFRLASAEEIGSWVQSTADHSLAERRKKLAVVERELNRRQPLESGTSPTAEMGGRNREETSTVIETPGRPAGSFMTRVWTRARRLFTP